MNISIRAARLGIALLLPIVLAACQSAATLSLAVRSGDTFLVGLSGEPEGPLTNTESEILRAGNLRGRIVDSAGATRDVHIRSVFRVFGDPTANPLAADRGQWLAVIDLVDNNQQPLDLNSGEATLTISSGRLIEPLRVRTVILDGAGEPHPLLGSENNLEKLGFLEPADQALVSVSGNADGARVGALQVRFHVDQVQRGGPFGPVPAIDAVKLNGTQDISFYHWSQPGRQGGTDLIVVMTAPDGVEEDDLHYFNLALVSGQIGQAENPRNYFSGSLRETIAYDVDGNELPGIEVSVGPVL